MARFLRWWSPDHVSRGVGVGIVLFLGSFVIPLGALAPRGVAAASPVVRYPSIAFVVTCSFSHRSNDDPIMHGGHSGASHGHDFFGNTTTGAASDASSLSQGSTTCNEAGDRAAYWLPTLAGAGWNTRMRAYYTAGGLAPSAIVSYPPGIQLIAGSAVAAEPSGVDVVGFSCGRGVDAPGWTAKPTTCAGPTTVRLTFPQCWDGRKLAAPGNAVAPRGGRCPSSHPVSLPLLRIVVSSKARVAPADFATSAGGANRLHADFFNAWNPTTLDRLVAVCTRGERSSNRDVKQCRAAGTGPRAAGGANKTETNF